MSSAFAYIYDECLHQPRFERELARIEQEVAHRGIEGRIARLALFRRPRDMVFDLVRSGVKNIVFVGLDQTLQNMMWFLPDVDAAIGFIPLVDQSPVGELLGIPVGVGAVDVLAARLVETLDVGKINDRYFLTEAVLPSFFATLEIEKKYRLTPVPGSAMAVRNLGSRVEDGKASADPKDGWLEIVIQTPVSSKSSVTFWKKPAFTETRLYVQIGHVESSEPMDVYIDGHPINGFSFMLSIEPRRLRMITGRQRRLG